MFQAIKEFFFGKPTDSGRHPLDGATRAAQEKAAPYKIEPPATEVVPVDAQITDAVTQAPKKEKAVATKKPATPKKPAEPKKSAPAKKPKKITR
jgi:hypothetical protein